MIEKEVEPDPSVRENAARELNAWLNDWRETARALVTRRDYQIMLGLAQRRAGSAEEEDEPPTSTSSNRETEPSRSGLEVSPAANMPPSCVPRAALGPAPPWAMLRVARTADQ